MVNFDIVSIQFQSLTILFWENEQWWTEFKRNKTVGNAVCIKRNFNVIVNVINLKFTTFFNVVLQTEWQVLTSNENWKFWEFWWTW